MVKQSLEFTPKDGKAIRDLVVQLEKTPASVIKRYKELTGDRAPG